MTTSSSLTWTGYFSFVLIGWNAVLVPTLIRSLEHDFQQTDASLGLFFFISAVLYASGSFSGGFLTERVGRPIVLVLACLLLGAGLGGQALAQAWVLFILAALFVNWGAGVIDGGVNGLFLDLFRGARGGAMNFLHLFFALGALLSPFIVGRLVAAGLPWRVVMATTAVVAVGLGVRLAFTQMPSGRHQHADITVLPTPDITDVGRPSDGPPPAVERRSDGRKGTPKGRPPLPCEQSTQPPDSADAESPRERSLIPFFALAAAICLYVAAEAGVSNWLVKFLNHESVAVATTALSGLYLGLALGRFLSNWIADRLDYVLFTVICIVLSSAAIIVAVVSPVFLAAALFFGLAGLFQGPIYPMIMSIGGDIYPHRLARLSGGLAGAAVVGSIAYPPTMGLLAGRIGLGAGLIGAGLLGIPMTAAIVWAKKSALRMPSW